MWAVVVAVAPIPKVPLNYNLRNLTLRWKTTVMTALAFTLVTALLTVLLAFVNGMNHLTEGSGQPGNVIVLSDGATDEVMSKLPTGASIERLPQNVQKKVLRAADGQYLATKEIYVIVSQPLQSVSGLGAKGRLTQMRGLYDPEIASQVHGVTLIKGRWFNSTGEKEVVLGEGIAQLIARDRGLPAIEPGKDEVELGPWRWRVVGIMKTSGTTFDSEIWGSDRALATKTFGRENSYTSYVIRTAGSADATLVAKELKDWRGEWSFDAFSEMEYYSKFNRMTTIFLYAIIVVALVMAAGGALGITNTMFAAISQRSKDIGVLRLLGFTRGQVLTSFLLESLVIALAGGLLGCALGYLANGWKVSGMIASGGGGGRGVVFELIVDPAILAICLGFSLLMGAVGGLIPALTATRLRPLESLR